MQVGACPHRFVAWKTRDRAFHAHQVAKLGADGVEYVWKDSIG